MPERIPKKVLDAYREGEEAHLRMSAAGGRASAEQLRRKRAEDALLDELALEETMRGMEHAANERRDSEISEDDR